MSEWNPTQYLEFADERTRPASDLLKQIPVLNPERVIDLGCGAGNSTALLAAKWPTAELHALDNSPSMLAEAKKSSISAKWLLTNLATWEPEASYDVIFSNAAFQWLPNQAALVNRLMGFVTRGGAFAFQVPNASSMPWCRIINEVSAEHRWQTKLGNARRPTQEAVTSYYDILRQHTPIISIWETEYLHALRGEDPVFRWISGTALRPILDTLEASERVLFEEKCKEQLRRAYPRRPDGETLLPFKRIFVVAIKK